MKNYAKMHAVTRYFEISGVQTPPNIMYISQPLTTELKGSMMIALVENLWYTLDMKHLTTIKQVAEKCLPYCNGHEQLQAGCRQLIDILSQMIVDIKVPGNHLKSYVLRDSLYPRCHEISAYFEWVYQANDYKELANTITREYDKIVDFYVIRNDQLQLEASSGSNLSTEVCMRRILLLNKNGLPNQILYEYSPSQIDSIGMLIAKAQHSLQYVIDETKTIHQSRVEALQKLEAAEMRLGITQSEVMEVGRKLRQANSENERLNYAVQGLTQERQQLSQRHQQAQDALADAQRRIESRSQQTESEVNDLRRRIARLDQINRGLGLQLEDAERQNKQLKERVSRLQKDYQQARDEQIKRQREREDEVHLQRRTYRAVGMEVEPEVVRRERYSIQPVIQQPYRPQYAPTQRRTLSNNVDPSAVIARFGGNEEGVDLVKCKICEQEEESYQLFTCSHGACRGCVLNTLKNAIKNNAGELRCPTEGCGAPEDNLYLGRFLENVKEKELLEQYNKIKINQSNSIADNEKLVMCKVCKQQFFVPKTMQFLTHCNVVACLKCGENHNATVKCTSGQILAVIDVMDRPLICPQCLTAFDMDDKCKHVTCKACEPKKTQPDGICPICSVLRNPIKAHDNSYHRPDCIFYIASPEAPKYAPNTCIECKRLGRACDRPTKTFQVFVSESLAPEVFTRIQDRRKLRPLEYVQPKA